MAYTTIDDPSAYFQIALWTGNGGTLAVTNDGNSDLQPDLLWLKSRSGATTEHHLVDTTRGEGTGSDDTPNVPSNADSAEYDRDILSATGITSDGFSLDGYSDTNANTATHVGWQWKANGGSTTANGASGDIKASVTQREDTAKFSICTYTGTGISAGQSHRVNHGLGTTPHVMLFKSRGATGDWVVYHHKNTSAPETDYLVLNTTATTTDSANKFNDTAPGVSYATIGGDDNISSGTMLLYSFAEVQGYSKFGSYTGNASTDGTFVYLGFKPAWLLIKRTDGSGNWILMDTKRDTHNVSFKDLNADRTAVEGGTTYYNMDLLSNGVKFRNLNAETNGSGTTYVYMAFAEQPFVTSGGVPCTAR
jgi:hypothetical protein